MIREILVLSREHGVFFPPGHTDCSASSGLVGSAAVALAGPQHSVSDFQYRSNRPECVVTQLKVYQVDGSS